LSEILEKFEVDYSRLNPHTTKACSGYLFAVVMEIGSASNETLHSSVLVQFWWVSIGERENRISSFLTVEFRR